MRQKFPTELRPNCLLTRYPICFLHGLKNAFNALDYWHGIVDFLRAHGYETYDLRASWRGPNALRLAEFKEKIILLSRRFGKVHIFAHSLGALNALELAGDKELSKKIASITFISPPFEGTPLADIGHHIHKWGRLFKLNIFAKTSETLTPEGAEKIILRSKIPPTILVGSFISRPGETKISPKMWIQHKILTWLLNKKQLDPANDALVPLKSQLVALTYGRIFLEFPGDHNQIIGSAPWPMNFKTSHEHFLDHCIFLAEYDLSHTN
jgi:pimeloyl-ACP methyl ester carboxylesterase